MFPCDHCKTMNNFGDWAFNHGGLEVGLPAFELPMFAKCDYCRCQEEICFACLFRLKDLSLHSLPVAWCSWELVFYSLPPSVGDSFAAKELLSPLLSPRTILAHRIQSTAGRIWPNWKIWPLRSVPLWFSFDSLTDSFPFKDTRFCRIWRKIFISLWRFLIAKHKDQGSPASWRKWVQWPSLRMRNSCALLCQSKHFCQGVCQWKSRSRWDIRDACDSSEIVSCDSFGFLVADALETLRFTRTNIPVCFCRVVWILQCGRLFLSVVNWTSRGYFFRADDPHLAS